MSEGEQWIEIVGWERFQHYGNRRPTWIKTYTALLSDPTYSRLTLHQRGVLHGLWVLYAASNGEIPDSTAYVSRQLGERVSRATLDALSDAGFTRLVASAPGLNNASVDKETDLEEEKISTRQTPAPSSVDAFRSSMSISQELSKAVEHGRVKASDEVARDATLAKLVETIRDADERTVAIVGTVAKGLPEASIAQAREALLARRAKPGKPLESEARYVVATLQGIARERAAS